MAPRRFALLACLAITVIISGCASPHYLQPMPTRTVAVPLVGQGQMVAVSTIYEPQSRIIGTRTGNAMSTSTITIEPAQLKASLQAEAERAVSDMGFTPSATSSASGPKLTLTLETLGYERGAGRALIDEASIQAVLIAEAANQGTTYTGTYTVTRNQSFAVGMRPSKKSNLQMIEALLADALNRAFSDPKLAGVLAR
ncbi:YajG family lipoprotein [Halomonas halocynthiae]|uniref:YajG family lipoprotein n=1 Tax=Halomonas halocynthiae TaxID=176290 RepID=UPI00040DF22C|nr:YajG family lipoprotein [Halomonas halocynthiae]